MQLKLSNRHQFPGRRQLKELSLYKYQPYSYY